MKRKLTITVPASFSFAHTIRSHGWYDLKPFELDAVTGSLNYVFRDLQTGKIASGNISENGDKVTIKLLGDIGPHTVREHVRHMLRLDEDIEDFYAAIQRDERLAWAVRQRAGRILRSPTVFEDLVKTLCTTNCSWGLTRNMTANLVSMLGDASEDGRRSFPTPEAMASADADFYRNEIRAGYRSPYFVELAESAASGKLRTDEWLDPDLPTPELKKRLKSIKGFGEYSADNMLKLLGRYDGLALDSWVRSQFYKKHNRGSKCPDKKIEQHYRRFGKWCGLVIWCDVTEDWFESEREA